MLVEAAAAAAEGQLRFWELGAELAFVLCLLSLFPGGPRWVRSNSSSSDERCGAEREEEQQLSISPHPAHVFARSHFRCRFIQFSLRDLQRRVDVRRAVRLARGALAFPHVHTFPSSTPFVSLALPSAAAAVVFAALVAPLSCGGSSSRLLTEHAADVNPAAIASGSGL